MKKKIIYFILPLLAVVAFLTLVPPHAQAQIINPVLSEELGQSPNEARAGITFVRYFVSVWRAIISVGSLLVLVNFVWGSVEWITAGGDSGKIGKARDKLTQSVIGLVILVSSALIIAFIGRVFFGSAFNILQPRLPSNIEVPLDGIGYG